VLRPLAGMPDGPLLASRVAASVDGEPVATAAEFREPHQVAHLPLPPARRHELTLRLDSGNVPLLFPPGAVEVVGAATHALATNGLLLLPLALLPGWLALALASLVGTAAALPTQTALVGVVLFVTTVGGLGPYDDAVRDLLRGRWLATAGVFPASASSLGLGGLAMILAMLVRRRCPR
jgi:hypothetical protein